MQSAARRRVVPMSCSGRVAATRGTRPSKRVPMRQPTLRVFRTAMVFAVLSLFGAGCGGGPTSPSEALVGLWHGTSAEVTAGPPATWLREDMILREDGSMDITEYEGLRRRGVGTWSASGSSITIRSADFYDREGTVQRKTMTLSCVTDSRTFKLVFEKQ